MIFRWKDGGVRLLGRRSGHGGVMARSGRRRNRALAYIPIQYTHLLPRRLCKGRKQASIVLLPD